MRACRGRIWALLYLSACASSGGARARRSRVMFKAFYIYALRVKQGTPKARSLTWQSCSRPRHAQGQFTASGQCVQFSSVQFRAEQDTDGNGRMARLPLLGGAPPVDLLRLSTRAAIADVSTLTPWTRPPDQGCRGRPRSTSRVSTPPLPLSPLPPPRFLPGSRLGSLCDGPSARCRPMKAGSVSPSVLGSHSSLVGENETPHSFLVLPASSAAPTRPRRSQQVGFSPAKSADVNRLARRRRRLSASARQLAARGETSE